MTVNDIYNGIGGLWDWITGGSLGGVVQSNAIQDTVNNIITYPETFFTSMASAVTSAMGALLFYLFNEPIGFLAGLMHFLQLAGDLVNYLIAPFWYLANFLAGFFSYVSMPAAIVASNNAYTNGAINNFLLNFPGYSEVIIIINAALWAMLAFHVLRELKHI